MTKLEDLTELACRIEAGECHNDGGMFKVFGDNWTRCFDAFHGSLDAAKALHEAVLPGWAVWDKSRTYFGYEVALTNGNLDANGCSKVSEARAWLLAILKALIAQEMSRG